jgi:predicted MFS family arabinose efflux permease
MRRDFKLVLFSLLCWGIGESLFFYFQPLYLEELGADPVQIGGFIGLASMALMVTHIPAGALADHFGRKRLLVAGWLSGLFATAIMFLAPSLPIFVIGMVLYSFTGFVLSPLSSYITAVRGNWSVARALTTTNALFALGSIIGALLGGILGEKLGLRSVYGIASGLFLISAFVIFFIRRQPIEPVQGATRYSAIFKNAAFGRFLCLSFIAFFGMYLSWPLTPNYLQNIRNVPLRAIGVFGSFNALGVVLINLSLGRLSSRTGFALAQLAVGLSATLLWLGTGMPYYALGYFLVGGYRAARSLANAQAESLVNQSQLGLTFGLVETVIGFSQVIAAPVAGLLYRAAPVLPFPVSLGIVSLSVLFAIWLKPKKETVSGSLEPGSRAKQA